MLFLSWQYFDEKAAEDAWVFFFAPTEAVKKLLEYQKVVDIKISDTAREIGPDKKNDKKIAGGKYFYFQWWGKRKLILSPFLQPYHDNGNDISMLISEIKDYFKV